MFLGAFAKLRKASTSFFMSARLHATIRPPFAGMQVPPDLHTRQSPTRSDIRGLEL